MEKQRHFSVMEEEVLSLLRPSTEGIYVDGTTGAGGHSEAILRRSSSSGILIALDLDPQALEIAQERLKQFGDRAVFIRENFKDIPIVLDRLNIAAVDGILLDLGISSMQLADKDRGFSFLQNGSLDMRVSPNGELTAMDLVNRLPAEELANLIYRFGEERRSRRIAKAIINWRRQKGAIKTTGELAEIVAKACNSPGYSRIHPATRTFMALRIAVNKELENLEEAVNDCVTRLKPGGRMAIISFHSLEDRIVKNSFKRLSGVCGCSPYSIECSCGAQKILRVLTKKPITPQQAEVEMNPPSRSAKLRGAERL